MWKPSDIGFGILCLLEGICVLLLGVWVTFVELVIKLWSRMRGK